MRLNMKLSIGFKNETDFIQLLTPNIARLMFQSTLLTDAMLQCIGERCKHLQELRICESNQTDKMLKITSNGLMSCIKKLPNITELHISGCDKVKNETIEIISKYCPKIRSLWINDCKNVTDACSEFLKSMPLNDLSLANTSVFTLINLHSHN